MIGAAFVARPCSNAFNKIFAYFVARKLNMHVPATKLIQNGELEYGNFQNGIERVTRLDENTRNLVTAFLFI